MADDNAMIRRLIRNSLESKPSYEVCGKAVDGADALKKRRIFGVLAIPEGAPACMLQNANGGVVSGLSRLEIICPFVRPIERGMREPGMDPQSTVFPAQP